MLTTPPATLLSTGPTTGPTTGLSKGDFMLLFHNSTPKLGVCTSTAAQTIKLGYVSPETGPLAPFGEADSFVIGAVRKYFAQHGVTEPIAEQRRVQEGRLPSALRPPLLDRAPEGRLAGGVRGGAGVDGQPMRVGGTRPQLSRADQHIPPALSPNARQSAAACDPPGMPQCT